MPRDYLRPIGAVSTSGALYSPFFAYLTDDGTDRTLNEDYSGAATDAYWQCPSGSNALISAISVTIGDGDFTEAITIANGFGGITLTNGIKFGIKNSGGTLIQDLTTTSALFQTGDLAAFGTNSTVVFSNFSATTANNEFLFTVTCNTRFKFGGFLFVPKEGRFVCTLQDNFSALEVFNISVSGHYV